MKRERCSLELKTLSGLVPCNPMTRDGKVPTPVTVRPYIGSEDDLTGCFLKKSSVICDSKNWLVTPTARSDFRVINHDFHAATMASRSFVRCGISFSSRSCCSKRSRLRNSQH